MNDTKRRLNEYLFYEMGFDAEDHDSEPSEDWPFKLTFVGKIELDSYTEIVFSFEDDETYFAFAGRSLSFLPAGRMNLDDLRHQLVGSSWIASQDPVSLEQSLPGEADVPSGLERRATLEEMARAAHPLSDSASVLEGLYLRKSRKYLALVCAGSKHNATVFGTELKVVDVPFPQISACRRLSAVIGRLIEQRGTL